jgi:hypothetical protein
MRTLSPSWPGLTRPSRWRRFSDKEHGGWVYIMTNRPNGILYIEDLEALVACVEGAAYS